MRKVIIILVIIIASLIIYLNLIKSNGENTVLSDWCVQVPIRLAGEGSTTYVLQAQADLVADTLGYKLDPIISTNTIPTILELSNYHRLMRPLYPFWIKSIRVRYRKIAYVDREFNDTKIVDEMTEKEREEAGWMRKSVQNVHSKVVILPNEHNPYDLSCKINNHVLSPGADITVDYETNQLGYVSVFLVKTLSHIKIMAGNVQSIGSSSFLLPSDIRSNEYMIIVIAHKNRINFNPEKKYLHNNGTGDFLSLGTLFKLVRKQKQYSFKAIPIKVFGDE